MMIAVIDDPQELLVSEAILRIFLLEFLAWTNGLSDQSQNEDCQQGDLPTLHTNPLYRRQDGATRKVLGIWCRV